MLFNLGEFPVVEVRFDRNLVVIELHPQAQVNAYLPASLHASCKVGDLVSFLVDIPLEVPHVPLQS